MSVSKDEQKIRIVEKLKKYKTNEMARVLQVTISKGHASEQNKNS